MREFIFEFYFEGISKYDNDEYILLGKHEWHVI